MGKTVEKIISRIKGTEQFVLSRNIFLKAMPLHDLEDVDLIKSEVSAGNILIIKVTPLAEKNVENVKRAVSELNEFTKSIGGDIARLGQERVVITPSFIRIWRRRAVLKEEITIGD
jgi:SepF-like predicted cell division protein (DUF552 family)